MDDAWHEEMRRLARERGELLWKLNRRDRIEYAKDKKAPRPYFWSGKVRVDERVFHVGAMILDGETCWCLLTSKGNPSPKQEATLTEYQFNVIDDYILHGLET